jgi:hypothetical protein
MKHNKSTLLWVKLPAEHAEKLTERAHKLGISRADFIRMLLINFLTAPGTSAPPAISEDKENPNTGSGGS